MSVRSAKRLSELIVLSAVALFGVVSAANIDLRNVPTTALMIKQLSSAYFVNGDDGNVHVEYDLLVTNAFTGPVTLKFVDVTDENGKTLMRLDGDRLVQTTQTLLGQKPVKSIPASSAVSSSRRRLPERAGSLSTGVVHLTSIVTRALEQRIASRPRKPLPLIGCGSMKERSARTIAPETTIIVALEFPCVRSPMVK